MYPSSNEISKKNGTVRGDCIACDALLCPPTKSEGGRQIGFSADPVGVGVRVGVGLTNSCTHDIS